MRRPVRNAGAIHGVALFAALLGCGDPSPEGGDSAAPESALDPVAGQQGQVGPIREVVLFDTIPWEGELASGAVYRIAVHTAGGVVDTLDDITAERPPIMVGDSAVHGLVSDGASVERGFVWRASTGALESVELPADFTGFLAHAIAPDANYLAYVARDPDGLLRAAVRGWPGGEEIYTSTPVRGYPSDALNSAVTWSGRDRVEIRIRLDVLDPARETWLAVQGRPAADEMTADTVVVAPR